MTHQAQVVIIFTNGAHPSSDHLSGQWSLVRTSICRPYVHPSARPCLEDKNTRSISNTTTPHEAWWVTKFPKFQRFVSFYYTLEMTYKPINQLLSSRYYFTNLVCNSFSVSAMYREAALKEKDRAAELIEMGNFCEELAKDLIGIGIFILIE